MPSLRTVLTYSFLALPMTAGIGTSNRPFAAKDFTPSSIAAAIAVRQVFPRALRSAGPRTPDRIIGVKKAVRALEGPDRGSVVAFDVVKTGVRQSGVHACLVAELEHVRAMGQGHVGAAVSAHGTKEQSKAVRGSWPMPTR